MKVIYFADDGTKFDSKTDCENYEHMMKMKKVEYPIVADEKGKIIDLKTLLSDENTTPEIIEATLVDIWYIRAEKNVYDSYENLRSLMWEYGFELPPVNDVITAVGIALYYYCEDNWHEGWKNYFDLENEFYKLENQFNMMF